MSQIEKGPRVSLSLRWIARSFVKVVHDKSKSNRVRIMAMTTAGKIIFSMTPTDAPTTIIGNIILETL